MTRKSICKPLKEKLALGLLNILGLEWDGPYRDFGRRLSETAMMMGNKMAITIALKAKKFILRGQGRQIRGCKGSLPTVMVAQF